MFPCIVPVASTVAWRAETQNSVWVIQPDGFIRLPRNGEARDSPKAFDDVTFIDGALIPYRDVYLCNAGGYGWMVQVVPSHRPDGAQGVQSGVIVNASIRPPTGEAT